jgi:HPt (histidine-containing phosphotransfer) domain-containing protein/HAMP domain-containing protein/anti-sigma regulatory factor (Ser/Thr protein kinase)
MRSAVTVGTGAEGGSSRSVTISIGTKLALATVLVLGVVSVVLFVELADRERQSLVRAKETAAAMLADLFSASLSAPLDFADSEAVEKEIDEVRASSIVTCAAVWQEGQGGVAGERIASGPPECVGTLVPETTSMARVYDDRIVVSRVVLGRSATPVGLASVVFSLVPENTAYKASRLRILGLSLALAGGTATLLILIARSQIVSPLRTITAAAVRMREGDRSARVDFTSGDEIGVLAGAFNAMGSAVADREASLQAVTLSLRELFDHMRQAICAFGPDAIVHGAASAQAKRLFARADLEGQSIRDLLYGHEGKDAVDARAFDEWVSLAFSLAPDHWSDLDELAPKLAVLRREGGEEIPLELEFRPVARGDKIERVMLLATDVSDKRRLERAVQTKDAEHARRMAAMRRLIAGGSQVFLGFIEAARQRVATCIAALGPRPTRLETHDIDEMFRHVHTIKGEARSFELPEVESIASLLEADLDGVRGRLRHDASSLTAAEHAVLAGRLVELEKAIARGSEVFVAASPIGRAALEQVTVQRSDLTALLELAQGRDEALREVAGRLSARPFGESAASLADNAPSWAELEGKQLRVSVEGREVGVPPGLAKVLGGVLTHLVRNAIAHGIEAPADRERAGKPQEGTLKLQASERDGRLEITVEDDGGGIDAAAIAAKAKELGLAPSPAGSLETMFAAGLTTAQSGAALAGRGVGLGAARSDLEGAGYTLRVETELGRFTRFTLSSSS